MAETFCGFRVNGFHCLAEGHMSLIMLPMYTSCHCHHWDILSQLSILTYTHLRTETVPSFPQRNNDIYKCLVTKMSHHRDIFKWCFNTNKQKQFILEFLTVMDKS